MRCVECRQKNFPWTRQHVYEHSLCQHPICVYSQECHDIHMRTCVSYCRDVGRTPEPHPRDLARQAEEAANPRQLDLFAEL
ncbi:hypothetical protein [Nonomuraea cavernae]|uniref:Uncharacterized protein n=1 Tax=Nonomuraea cavernae TaxID=2045107 RepID=A0A917YPD2_9ACTN|nr:hypothetical protein [Nonomuraea cavernae]MCA2184705.1 hypothetical protein [Nonomuraea cavernae]GGO63008.1 hypothetical protein GCM10012289_08920 [Nonomuraea cavernae]